MAKCKHIKTTVTYQDNSNKKRRKVQKRLSAHFESHTLRNPREAPFFFLYFLKDFVSQDPSVVVVSPVTIDRD